MFHDRLKKVAEAYSITLYSPRYFRGEIHEILNTLDDIANMSTVWRTGHDGCCAGSSQGLMGCRRYVGARLALHELRLETFKKFDKMDSEPERYFHWLGNEADTERLAA